MNSESKRINLIQFLIANGGLSEQVRLSLSKRTIDTDEDTIKQIGTVLGANQVCDIESDTIQPHLLRLVNQGESNSVIKKDIVNITLHFFHKDLERFKSIGKYK